MPGTMPPPCQMSAGMRRSSRGRAAVIAALIEAVRNVRQRMVMLRFAATAHVRRRAVTTLAEVPLLDRMRGQGMIGGLVEERGPLGDGLPPNATGSLSGRAMTSRRPVATVASPAFWATAHGCCRAPASTWHGAATAHRLIALDQVRG